MSRVDAAPHSPRTLPDISEGQTPTTTAVTPSPREAVGTAGGAQGNLLASWQPPNFCTDTRYGLSNPNASPEAAGDLQEQSRQAGLLLKHSSRAALSHVWPGSQDGEAAKELAALSPNPPLSGARSEHVEYTSTLHGVAPEAAFAYALGHPAELFGTVGITLHPPASELKDGARLFLQEPGVTPPVWAPVEVRVDAEARQLSFNTLDGHPLRGTNVFRFSGSEEGTQLQQVSDFQLSSFAAEGGAFLAGQASHLGVPQVQDPIERQHQIWQAFHAHLADYAGR